MSELAERKGAEYCTAILRLYVFTGEDATSALKGKGKVGPLKKLHNHQTLIILTLPSGVVFYSVREVLVLVFKCVICKSLFISSLLKLLKCGQS